MDKTVTVKGAVLLKQSHTEEFNRQLYNTIRQSAQNCVIPSFDGLARRIQRDETVECFGQFFADEKTFVPRLPQKFHSAAWVAAAAVLTVSGLLVGSLLHARAYDTSENASAAQAMVEEEATAEDMAVNEALADEAEDTETKKAAADAALPSSDDCAQAILSGGRQLLASFDELTKEN